MSIASSGVSRFSHRRTFAVLLAGAACALPAGVQAQGSVRGVILDSLGGSVSGAQVTIEGIPAPAVTDGAGAFRFQRVPAGVISLRARRLGYRPGSLAAEHRAAAETVVELRLAAVAEVLPTVEVRRRAEVYDSRLAGFNSRKEKRVGHFITRDQLDRHDSPRLADALRAIPGVVVRPLRGSGGGSTVSIRGNCSPLVFLDGFPAAAGALDLDMVDLSTVEGIEVYSGISTVPPEFTSVRGGERCGVLAIWSRPARPRQRRLTASRAGDLDRAIESRSVYTAAQVDQPAILAPGTVTPIYPDTLWRAGVEGRVVAEFVVGQDGIIEQGTFGIASTTHPYFSAAVRTAVEGAIFRAASLAGKKVRQFVQLPFVFEPLGEEPAGRR